MLALKFTAMKTRILTTTLALGALLAATAPLRAHQPTATQPPQTAALALEDGVQVKIDGQEVGYTDELVLEKDQIYKLEVLGLKPNSTVGIVIKKAGIKVFGADHKVGEKGSVSEVIETPESGGGAQCIITYVSALSGKSYEVKFKIKLT